MYRTRLRLSSLLLLVGIGLAMAGCSLFVAEPVARFDILPVVAYVGDTVTFDASASTSSASLVSYRWTLADGASLAGVQATTTFAKPGIYEITLRIADDQGQSASVSQELVVYVRSGTVILDEGFDDGETALGRWPLDSTWASESESRIEYISGNPGYVLRIDSGSDRWHRRYTVLDLPPLRTGQRLVFSWAGMALQNQDGYTFMLSPARVALDTMAGALPYYEFTSTGGGSYIREVTAYGTVIGHPVAFEPNVYRWYRYSISYSADSYVFSVNDVEWQTGPLDSDITEGGRWLLVLGEDSQTEACHAMYDDIRVTVVE